MDLLTIDSVAKIFLIFYLFPVIVIAILNIDRIHLYKEFLIFLVSKLFPNIDKDTPLFKLAIRYFGILFIFIPVVNFIILLIVLFTFFINGILITIKFIRQMFRIIKDLINTNRKEDKK